MLDDLIFALRNFRRNKIRSFLSLLGIIIGVASVMTIVSVLMGMNQKTMEMYRAQGDNKITAFGGVFVVQRRCLDGCVAGREGHDLRCAGVGCRGGCYFHSGIAEVCADTGREGGIYQLVFR